MPIDDLTALGQKMREARKKKDLTQQELADLSHVSVKQIANIEKGKMNPSYLILRALAKSSRKIRSISPAIFWSKIMALTSKLSSKLRMSMFAVP